MKNKPFNKCYLILVVSTFILIVGFALAVILFREKSNMADDSVADNVISEESLIVYSTVQVLEETSGMDESTYWVGVTLPSTDFSVIGQVLEEEITREWEAYRDMSAEQRMASSRRWGVVGIQTDTWAECENAIGFAVYNPLEALDWLEKTGYYGMESTASDIPVKHVQVIADTALNGDGTLNRIDITAGYNIDNVRITLAATLWADTGTYTTGSVCNGYATYEQSTVTTQSGISVLVVTTDETNNNGYYLDDYFDPTAYWVKDNVFYTLRVLGEEADKEHIQTILEQILGDI